MYSEPGCRECGASLPTTSSSSFCGKSCRKTYNNRRAMRGAQLYDLFMASRYDRINAQELGVWTYACRMGEAFRDEDVRDREGRPSWRNPKEVLDNRTDLKARVVGVVSKR